jgi:serine/threonine protein kinase
MMREVSHPNLLKIFEIFEGDNNIYCVGKLYKGVTLSSLIQDRNFKFEERVVVNLAGKLIKVGFIYKGSRVFRVQVHYS